MEVAGVVLAQLSDLERAEVAARAEHIREVLTGYKSGHSELRQPGEPRPDFDPQLPMEAKYAAKSAELAVTDRTIKRWVRAYRQMGVAGLANETADQPKRTDGRWIETALEVMIEHTDQSRPSQTMVIDRTNARVVARFGDGVVKSPSRATAHRILAQLEKQHPTFRLSTKRNRDIAERPDGVYGKLRPTRPGEYLLMDTPQCQDHSRDDRPPYPRLHTALEDAAYEPVQPRSRVAISRSEHHLPPSSLRITGPLRSINLSLTAWRARCSRPVDAWALP
jgi:transposase